VSTTWIAVAAVGIATVAIKASGPVVLGDRPLPAWLRGPLEHLAPALLAALVATAVLARDGRLVVDARLAGLAVAGVAIALRAPILVVVVAAAAVTALVRALG
jgi:branched-subunit amino acid transport protein